MTIALLFHLIGVVIWVGGMFFAYMALRPAAGKVLEPAQRLPLWSATFAKFFPWVWVSILLIVTSGLYLVFALGGFRVIGLHVQLMILLAIVMVTIFAHVYYAPFRKLKRHVALKDWPQAGTALNQIRTLVGVNLILGFVTVAVATVGKALL